MKILCPHCGFTKEVDPAKLPAGAKRATCPKCKNKFDLPDLTAGMATPPTAPPQKPSLKPPVKPPVRPQPAAVPPPIEDRPPFMDAMADDEPGYGPPPMPPQFPGGYDDGGSGKTGIPWEDRPGGFFRDLFSTIIMVLLHPGEFFDRMPVRGGFKAPLTFTILISMFTFLVSVGLVAAAFSFLIGMLPSDEVGQFGAVLAAFQMLYIAGFVVCLPLLIIVGMYISAAIVHVLLVIVRGASGGYEATFRVLSYGSATVLISIVPVIGGLVYSIYFIVLNVMGLSRAHQTSAGKVILAVFVIPICLCLLFTIGGTFLTGMLLPTH